MFGKIVNRNAYDRKDTSIHAHLVISNRGMVLQQLQTCKSNYPQPNRYQEGNARLRVGAERWRRREKKESEIH